ncbi:MAG: RNA methyltransferase [Sulfuritalea sp.]|nr:RNA methyltransferase [Sulfuritalea sp.]
MRERQPVKAPRHISSRDNAIFKQLRALADDPRHHGRALLDGIHLVAECLRREIEVQQLLVSESGLNNPEVGALLKSAAGVDCVLMRDSLFREFSGIATPTGIAAIIEIPAASEGVITGDALLLDAVQDAGNVGTILRTAAAAGVRDVLLGPGCAGAWTPRVLRAGQGAHFSLAIRERVDLKAALAACQATSVATVAHGGTSLYELDLAGPIAWLVGNEGAGLAQELVDAAGLRATIPLAGSSESLNVAAATAVCLFEVVRQRNTASRSANS